MTKMSRDMDRMMGGSARSIANVDRALASMRGGIAATAGVMTAAGAGAGFALGSVISAGAQFDAAMSSVGAVSLLTRDQIKDLEKRALELGSSTKFSATEVAQAMELMGRAGFTNAETLSGIEGILSAAAAEGAELAVTAGHVSNVLKGMGLATSETTRVADVLTLASAKTNSSISSLGESMSKVSATARQFKIPFEDAVASVALLQDVGLDASEAGSAVDTMLTMLASPTDAVAAKMKKLGVTFQDAKGDMLPFASVLKNFATASQKSGGNMEQAAFFAELLGMRGQRAAVNLKDLFASGKVGELTTALERAGGSAAKMADLRMDNLTGDWDRLMGSIEGVQIKLFNLESGPLRGVVQEWEQWVTANEGLIVSGVQGFLVDLRRELPGLAMDVKVVGGATLDFFRGVRENLPTIVVWTERLAYGAAAAYGVSAAVKTAQGVMVMWRGAMVAATYVTTVGTVGNTVYTASLASMRIAAITAGHGLGTMRTAMNATALASSINGVTNSLGKAGLYGAALGVGVAIGSWLNHTFDLENKLGSLMAKFTGLEDQLNAGGKRYTTRAEANRAFVNDGPVKAMIGETRPDGFNMEAAQASATPMLVTQEQRIASAMATTTTEKAEITVRAEQGTTAEVTKDTARGARTKLKLPSSGRPRT